MTNQSQMYSAAELAAQAAAAYKWTKAVAHYTEALGQPDLPLETTYSLRDGRATAYLFLGDFTAEQADLVEMARLAESLADRPRQVEALTRQVAALCNLGELVTAQTRAEAALALAASVPALEAAGRHALGRVLIVQGNYAGAHLAFERALALYRNLGDPEGEAHCLTNIARTNMRTGRLESAAALAEQALAQFRRLHNRAGEAEALNRLGNSSSDAARQRAYYQQALEIYQELNDRPWQAKLANNLGLLYWRLGMYGRANDYAGRAVQAAREMQAQGEECVFLDGLGRSYLGLGLLTPAEQAFQAGLELARQASSRYDETLVLLGLGWVALARGRFPVAADFFHTAASLCSELGMLAEQATALAWLGAAHLAGGRLALALSATSQATDLLAGGEVSTTEYLEQEVWWWRYKAGEANNLHPFDFAQDRPPTPSSLVREGQSLAPPLPRWERGLGDEGFLDRACQVMLAYVATLGDEGLRRNYLNKIVVNRQISLEWSRQAARRGLSLAPFTQRESGSGHIRDQLQRMLDIGVRLSQQRDPDKLPRFIIDEFVELCGAERILLLLADETQGELAVALTNNLTVAETAQAQASAQSLLERLRLTRQAILEEALGEIPPDDVPELHQRSALAVPLVSQGKLLGAFYADMRHIFGRLNPTDLELLTVLANQSAAALENAHWTRTLEQRVEQRTVALQAANAELATINTVSQALVSKLELDALIELIGEQMRQTFNADIVYVALYDRETNMIHFPYEYGDKNPARPFGQGLTERIIETCQPLLINKEVTERSAEMEVRVLGKEPLSYLGVPITVGQQGIGVISVQSATQEGRFGQADLNLLGTIAANVGAAIQNARLYTEAQAARLVAETTSRELAQTLESLQTTQRQLVEAEKMAALGGLVAGVAHEINTPVGVGVTAASLLEEKTRSFCEIYQSGQMKRSDLEKYLDTAGQSSSMILKNLQRAAELIQSFKQVAVDQSSEEQRVFAVKAYLDEILLSLHPKLKRTQLTTEIHADDSLTLDSYPGAFAQIVTNLVMNSLIHAYEPGIPGRLVFDLKQENSRFIFEYADDGRGIPQEYLSKIFDPFFTTKRGQGGSGLGLHIIYNLVTQKLNGTIRCESEVGQGTRFVIEVPVKQDKL